MRRLNFWFLTATIEAFLAFVLIVAGHPKAGAFPATLASVFIVIGMVHEQRRQREL